MADGWHRFSQGLGEQAARALLYRLGPQHFTDQVLLGWARSQSSANDAEWFALATLPARWTAPIFPLKAADFMKRGVAQGPALGAALAASEEAWIAAGFPGDQTALDSIAGSAVRAKTP
jgi:poly(A) polymerase